MIELEKKYWDLQQSLDLFEYLTPLNLLTEKKRFFLSLKENSRYNPIFKYNKIRYERKHALSILEGLAREFENTDSTLSCFYLELIEDDTDWINNLCEKRTTDFCGWISNLYGKPEDSLYKQALDIIGSLELENVNETSISSTEMRAKVADRLRQSNITDWNVEIKDSSARIFVNPVTKTIGIRKEATFSSREIDRLMAHEIGIHVRRYENGSRQRYLLFRKGFPNYMSTEEGLAILSESKNDLLSSKDLAKYCARLIASYLCFSCDFWDLFKSINTYLNVNDSFDVVARVKRGLVHTEQFGGFTKDQIYIAGYLEVKRLPLERIRRLFLGKIGIQHLDFIDQMDGINENVDLPEWFEK